MRLEINCPFIRTPITCICNIELLWSEFPVTILYSLSLILFKGWGCLASSFNVECLFYPKFLLFAPSPPSVWNHCPSHCYAVAFMGRCAPVFKIYSDWKIADPHFQEKKHDPSQSILASAYNCRLIKLLRQKLVSDNNLMLANKSNCEKSCFCFDMKILYF